MSYTSLALSPLGQVKSLGTLDCALQLTLTSLACEDKHLCCI